MNWSPLLGLLAVVYAALCFALGFAQQPEALWNMARPKLQLFEKVMGEQGTKIFIIVWGVGFLALGIWLFVAQPV